jgi:hypothetical protein
VESIKRRRNSIAGKGRLYTQKWPEVITLVAELEALGFYSLNANYFSSFSNATEFAENE